MFTKTQIILFLLVFYGLLITILGFVGQELLINNLITENTKEYTLLGTTVSIDFVGGIVASLIELGWLNVILFTPLGLTLAWIVISSLPSVNGGA